jgi:ribosomal protein S18 acetylase RimI-like enzyme
MTSLTFKPANPTQLQDVDALMRSAFTPYVRGLGRELTPDNYAWFGEAIKAGDIFAAQDGPGIVGAIATKHGEGDLILELIGVSPTRQKQGIASWMIGQVEQIARARGTRTLSLNTAEIMEDRVRLYSRHGFRIVRRGPPDHGKDAHVRVYMVKELSPG